MQQFLSNIISDKEIDSIQPGQFNVLRAPCGSGKTTFMFDEKILKFAGARKNVLYLIHNKVTRDFIAENHKDKAKVFYDAKDSSWFDRRAKLKVWPAQDENFIQVMCYQTFAALLRNEGIDWLDDIDLIVWDEFDDFRPFYEKEVAALRKVLPDFSREKLIALLQEGKTTSIVNFIYQLKTLILDPARIRLIAVSATPEFAASYFSEYLNYILTGKIENFYDAQQIIYIESIIKALQQGVFLPHATRRYWCYTKYVHEALRIEAMAKAAGFNTIAIWSENNYRHMHEYTEEKARVTQIVRDEHIMPQPYNFLITTGVLGRGVDIFDTTVQDWICNSLDYEEIVQSNRARFSPARQYLLEGAQGLVNFVQNKFATPYYEWHTVTEFKQLLEQFPIFDSSAKKRLTTVAAVDKEYPQLLEKRRYGKTGCTQYKLTKGIEPSTY